MPSSLDRYSTNGVKRSVTPEPFSAGITAKVISGYFAFQSSADVAERTKASDAAPARTIRRLIMMNSPVVVKRLTGRYRLVAAALDSRITSGRGRGAQRRNGD